MLHHQSTVSARPVYDSTVHYQQIAELQGRIDAQQQQISDLQQQNTALIDLVAVFQRQHTTLSKATKELNVELASYNERYNKKSTHNGTAETHAKITDEFTFPIPQDFFDTIADIHVYRSVVGYIEKISTFPLHLLSLKPWKNCFKVKADWLTKFIEFVQTHTRFKSTPVSDLRIGFGEYASQVRQGKDYLLVEWSVVGINGHRDTAFIESVFTHVADVSPDALPGSFDLPDDVISLSRKKYLSKLKQEPQDGKLPLSKVKAQKRKTDGKYDPPAQKSKLSHTSAQHSTYSVPTVSQSMSSDQGTATPMDFTGKEVVVVNDVDRIVVCKGVVSSVSGSDACVSVTHWNDRSGSSETNKQVVAWKEKSQENVITCPVHLLRSSTPQV